MKTLENLSEHSHPLSPLESGDRAFIQNQSGLFLKKWDKSGTVVEIRGHDQYVVKVAESGRLSETVDSFENMSNQQTAVQTNATPLLPSTGFEMPDANPEHETPNLPLHWGGTDRSTTETACSTSKQWLEWISVAVITRIAATILCPAIKQ